MTIDKTDALAGAFFIAVGGWFAVQALGMEIGTARRMGPGFFPLILAGVLILLGAVVLLGSLKGQVQDLGVFAVRGMLFILPAPVIFGLTVRPLGFVPAIALTTLYACLASRQMRPLTALILVVALTVFSTLVFSYGLGLPFRLIGPRLSF